MAKFGQGFLQALTQPSYSRGLFELGETLGSTPGRLARLEKMKNMGKVDLARMGVEDAARTGDPNAVIRAKQAEESVVAGETTRSLGQLDLARQKAVNENDQPKAQHIEDVMKRVAANAGLDASQYTGRTSEEFVELKKKREETIAAAYFKVEGKEKTQFIEDMTEAGFGQLLADLEEDRNRKELVQQQLDEVKLKATAPLPIKELDKSISRLPSDLQETYRERLEDIKNPDFENSETWLPGERDRAVREMERIADAVTAVLVRESLNRRDNISRLESQISSLKVSRDKITPTTNEIAMYIEPAMAAVKRGFGWGDVIDSMTLTSKDPRVKGEAARMAKEAKQAGLDDDIANLQRQLDALKSEQTEAESSSESSSESEESTADPLGIK